jgi:hypothetical protein
MLRKVLLTLMLRKGFINPNVESQPPCVQQRAGSCERGDQCDAGLWGAGKENITPKGQAKNLNILKVICLRNLRQL